MRFYVSSVGGDIGQSIIEIIASSFDSPTIIGTDLNSENSGKTIVDLFEISPPADHENYISWLSNFLKNNAVEYFIPVNEKELHALASISKIELSQVLGICTLIWAGQDSVLTFENKLATSRFLAEIGVRTPKFFSSPEEVSSADFPIIVKPNLGAGSRNLFVCNSKSELGAAMLFVAEPILQKYIGDADNEFTAGIFRSASGETKVITFRRKLSGGATSWAQVFPQLQIELMCREIASSIGLNGSINAQFRMDGDEPSVFEINGRFSSTVNMRHLLGFQDVLWSLGLYDTFSEFDQSRIAGAQSVKRNTFEVWTGE